MPYCSISYLLVTLFIDSYQIRFVSLACVPVCIFMAYFIIKLVRRVNVPLVSYVFMSFVIVTSLASGLIYASVVFAPVNGISNSYTASLNWLKNNTPANSTVLAFWEDGSEIEGVANRFVYSDSVALQSDPQNTSSWFFHNDTSLSQFHPAVDYLFIRSYQFNDSYGLCLFSLDGQNCTKNRKPYVCLFIESELLPTLASLQCN